MGLKAIVPNREKALFLAKKQLPELVWDAVNLEGIHFTLPEVQTLLDGITVGGYRLSDQRIALNQAAAWRFLFDAVYHGQFELTKGFVCALHAIAGEEEALEWGQFRSGAVTIAGTDYKPPQASGLDVAWEQMLRETEAIADVYDAAIFLFLQMARQQFFYDVNKRMGRFMMNGLLLSQGYPAINLPAKKQLEFNQLMLAFYASNDPAAMQHFMKNCIEAKVLEAMV